MITIVKYGVYQVFENPEEQQKNSKGTAEEQRRNNEGTAKEHKQERKKERKEEDIITVSKDTVQQIGVSFRIELTEVYHETIPKIFNKDKGILENL